MSNTFVVTFVCGHTVLFRQPTPKIGDIAYCLKCRMETRVMHAPPEWRTRCVNCKYSRRFGASQSDALIAIGKHRRSHPSHTLKLQNGNGTTVIYGNSNQTVITS
jgi:hypothetical protein